MQQTVCHRMRSLPRREIAARALGYLQDSGALTDPAVEGRCRAVLFEARAVTLGMKGDGYYQITGGDLHRGDRVVAHALVRMSRSRSV